MRLLQPRLILLALACVPALLAQTAYFSIDRTAVNVIDPAAHKKVTTLLAGSRSRSMATSPDGSTIYIANTDSRSITIIDAIRNQIVAEAPVGAPVYFIAVSPDNAFIYCVADSSDGRKAAVSKFDLATRKTVLDVPLGEHGQVYSVQVSADGGSLYVPLEMNWGQGIAILDTTTLTVQSVINVTEFLGPAFVRDGTAWMSCGKRVCKIDLRSGTLLAQSPPSYGGSLFCLDGALTKLYVNSGFGIYILDPDTLVLQKQIPGPYGLNARDILVGPGGQYLYASNTSEIQIYDTTAYNLQESIPFSVNELQTFRVSTSGMIYAVGYAGYPGDTIGALNTQSDTISNEFESINLASLAVSPDGSRLFGLQSITLYSVPLRPVGPAVPFYLPGQIVSSLVGYSADSSILYVTAYANGAPTYIDAVSVATGRVLNQLPFNGNLQYGPSAVLSPDRAHIYFATYPDNGKIPDGIQVLDTSTFTAQPIIGFMRGYNPIAVSSDGRKLFVEQITDVNNVISASDIILLDLSNGHTVAFVNYEPPSFPFYSTFSLGPKDIALYALTQNESMTNLTFMAFNPETLEMLGTYPLHWNIGSFAVTPDETHAFITLDRSRSILDLNLPDLTLHATIPTGYSPRAIALAP